MNVLCRIELFGGLCLEQAGQRITRFQTQKTATLLAFLAYHAGQPQPREALLELLWPDSDPTVSRNRLSTALSSLRRHLEPPGIPTGALIVANHATVHLRSEVLTTDVTEFEALLRSAAQARSPAARALFLTDALAVYSGSLLPGCYDEWAMIARQRLADLFFDASRHLIESLRRTGDSSHALEIARRAVSLDPLREEAHCDLIRLLQERGDTVAALRQVDDLIRRLEQDLGTQPCDEVRRLAETLAAVPAPPSHQFPALTTVNIATSAPPSEGWPSGTVTFLLTDIEGSTAQWERSGEAFREVLEWHHALLRAQFIRHHGREVKEAGDSFLVVFAHAADALACAIGSQRALAAGDARAEKGRLRVRIALHSGDMTFGKDGYQGVMLHHASRILSAAHGGQILCSEATAALLRRHLGEGDRLIDLGLYRLRDVLEPERLFMADYPDRAPYELPPLRAAPVHTTTMPIWITRFFGRDAEIERLQALLCSIEDNGAESIQRSKPGFQNRLITLTGTGGMGKTRLAVEAVQRLQSVFASAIWFVSLADNSDASRIVEAIAEALHLPRTTTGQPLDSVVEALSRQPSLLILDNFEQLVDEGAPIVRTLLERTLTLTCLVTSRRLLGLAGEQEVLIGPLPTNAQRYPPNPPHAGGSSIQNPPHAGGSSIQNPPHAGGSSIQNPPHAGGRGVQNPPHAGSQGREAKPRPLAVRGAWPDALRSVPSVALFVDRAQAARPEFQLTLHNAPAVTALVERLDGIPLAIELAAGRAQVLTPEGMLAQLEHGCAILSSRKRDANERHRTLRTAIEWSYRLLSPELQRLFAQLSVFRNGWTLEAAEQVCALFPSTVLDSTVLDSTVLDALQELRECSLIVVEESLDGMRFRMLETLREYAWEQLEEEERSRMRHLHCNYFAQLVEVAWSHFRTPEQKTWLERLECDHDNLRAALGTCYEDPEGGPQGMRLVEALAPFWDLRGYFREGAEWGLRLLAHPGVLDPTASRAKALNAIGNLCAMQGDHGCARTLYEQSLQIQRTLGNLGEAAAVLSNLGLLTWKRSDYASARALIEEAIALSTAAGNRAARTSATTNLAKIMYEQGDYEHARELTEQILALNREAGNLEGTGNALVNLGAIARAQGDHADAHALYEQALVLAEQAGDRVLFATILNSLGAMAHAGGDLNRARALHEQSLAINREIGDREGIVVVLDCLCCICLDQGDHTAARTANREGLTLARQLGDRYYVCFLLESAGELERVAGQHYRATTLYGAALALRAHIGVVMQPVDRQEVAASLAALRAALGDTDFEEATAAGGAMGWEQAIDLALEQKNTEKLRIHEGHEGTRRKT